ncbi:MAG: MFS transporter [Eggerthellaceae bacterium]|nr:MFS transporter [Eggerthellaceae bacterium]
MNERSTGYAWRNFIFVFLCGVAFSISLMVVPACMLMLVEHFQCDMSTAGWFMSWSSVAGTVIAFFTASIQSKVGPKAMVMLAMACVIVSDVICIFAPDATVFSVGRFILGFGNGLIATGAPTLICVLFKDPAKRGLPNSVWSVWIAVGQIIILNLFAILAAAFGGWQAGFWFALIFAVAALVLGFFLISVPMDEQMAVVRGTANVKLSAAFTSPYVIICLVMVICFAFCFSCYSAMAPTYYQQAGGMGMAEANSLNSVSTIVGVVGALAVGAVFAKVKNQPLVLLAVFVLTFIVCCFEFVPTDPTLIIVELVAFGFVINAVMPAVFTNVEWASPDPSVIGAAFGVLAIGSNAGGIPAAPLVGAILESTQGNWALATVPEAVIGAIGLICAIVFFVKRGPVCKAVLEERSSK